MTRMSERLWGLRWGEHLPWDAGDGIQFREGTLDEALPFIQAHYADIFELGDQSSRFLHEPLTPAKERFLRESDIFLVCEGDRTIGLFVSNPVDWSTYYHRSGAFLPQYQGRRLISCFLDRTEPVLRSAGCIRVEVDTASSNLAMTRVMTRHRFNITSTAVSERWGSIVRFTRFLTPDAEDVFLERFCCGVRYQRRDDRLPERMEKRRSA